MKRFLGILAPVLFAVQAYAHDEGHGPKLGDQPIFGGSVAAVIKFEEIDKGRQAELLYKAEITKNAKGVIRVYFYSNDMKPIKSDKFESASAQVQYRDPKTKKWVSKEFSLDKKGDHFEGNLPVKPRPPFNVDVKIEAKPLKLFIAFDNLS